MNHPKILIVEDEIVVAMQIEGSLNSLGYREISIVDTGEDAIALAQCNQPDIILMDIRIKGGMDGIETASRILANRDVPIIYLSANSNDDIIEKAKKTLPYGYLLKPYNKKELKIAIEMAVYHTRIKKEKREMATALAESEELHRQILNSISDTVFITNDRDEFTHICPNSHVNTGYSPTELEELGTSQRLFGRKLFRREELMAQQEISNIECDLTDKFGQQHHMLVSVRRVSIKGGNNLYTCRDITLHKETQKKLVESKANIKALIENTNAGIWSVNPNYEMIEANSVFKNMLESYLKRKLNSIEHPFVSPDFPPEVISIWKQFYDRALNGERFSKEIPNDFSAGSRVFECFFNPVISDPKGIVGVTVFRNDVTFKKQAEESIRLKQLELTEKNTALKVLLQQCSETRTEVEERILTNLQISVLPHIEQLCKLELNENLNRQLTALRASLDNLTSSFVKTLTSARFQMTPTEIKISNLIKHGNTSKEIAKILNLSIQTVESHRKSIRKKLGLNNSNMNLRTYLVSLE